MDWVRWEALSVVLLIFSVGAYALAWTCGNTEDMKKAKKATLMFAATSLALAFPLGVLHWQDLIGLAGLVSLWMAAKSNDRADSFALALLSAVLLMIWTWYYIMSGSEYTACFSLAVFNPLLVLWLKYSLSRRDPVSEMPHRHLNPT